MIKSYIYIYISIWEIAVLTVDSQTWDVRSAVLSGRRDQLIRWMIKMMEDATKKVRQFEDEGKNVTRWAMIYDLGYFNLAQSGCLNCKSSQNHSKIHVRLRH